MANVRTLQRSFAGGEVTPEFYGRIDDAKYASGLAICRNFVTKPHGPAENRAGFKFVREVKDSDKKVRLVPFTFSTTQTMVLEMGEEYFRFHTQGATLMDGNDPYEVAHPYQEEELPDVHVYFTVRLCRYLGYAPRAEGSSAGYFDIRKGSFTPFSEQANSPGRQTDTFDKEDSCMLHKILLCPPGTYQPLTCTGAQRYKFLNSMIGYYGYHMGRSPQIKSLDILHQIFL